MKTIDLGDLDLSIGRARIALSIVALPSLYVDPSAGGPFLLETHIFAILSLHLAYSFGAYLLLRHGAAPPRYPLISATIDILFATVIAVFTEGPTSPAYIFFGFAVIAVACRHGFRATLFLVAYAVLLYIPLIVSSPPEDRLLYLMRPVYLGVAGYLFSYLGQRRLNFEARLREVETAGERHAIARSLHDGYVQALAGVTLRLKTTLALLSKGRSVDALAELQDLQVGVAREYEQVRVYIRSLANLDDAKVDAAPKAAWDTRIHVRAVFTAEGLVVEQVLQILLEGTRNARKHGGARTATLDVGQADDNGLRIAIDDDGVGFRRSGAPPWSIASRVGELGGSFRIAEGERAGAHLQIELPLA